MYSPDENAAIANRHLNVAPFGCLTLERTGFSEKSHAEAWCQPGGSCLPEISHCSKDRPTGKTEAEKVMLGGNTHPDRAFLVLHTRKTPFKPQHYGNVNAFNTLENGLSGSPALLFLFSMWSY